MTGHGLVAVPVIPGPAGKLVSPALSTIRWRTRESLLWRSFGRARSMDPTRVPRPRDR
jgi:hypothetical protein